MKEDIIEQVKDFKDSMRIIIENFLKEPTIESDNELHYHTYLQVMRSFYPPEYCKQLYDSIKDV